MLAYYGKKNLEIQFKSWKIGDIKKFDVDNSKLKSIGFEFNTEFDDGLAQTLEWSRKYFER